jgi:hypothetical protein
MAITDLFFDTHPKLGHIELDCTVQETHVEGHSLSAYPIEAGADLSDHTQDWPEQLMLEGLISDVAPALFGGSFDFTQVALLNRSASAWEQLRALKKSKIPFTVVTSLRTYTNMIFADGESLIAERTFEDSTTLRFMARLEKWRVAFTTTAEAIAFEVADLAAQAASSGMQTAGDAAPATAAAAGAAV